MIIASGYLELCSPEYKENIIKDLNLHGIETPESTDTKVVFLIEDASEEIVKRKLDELKKIDGVLDVMLVYFSIAGAEQGESFDI